MADSRAVSNARCGNGKFHFIVASISANTLVHGRRDIGFYYDIGGNDHENGNHEYIRISAW